MAAKMHKWIISEVQEELAAAFKFLRPIYQLGDTIEENRYHCNLSCLTIHMREGKPVQLIEFNGKGKQVFEATVSDNETKIRAIFSKSSASEFYRKEGRPLTERTLGGVFQFTDYYLIFNPKSSPSKRLMFKVEQFRIIGSEGSATFGQPSKIEDRSSLREITRNLNALLCGNGDHLKKEMPSPLQSQSSNFRESPASTGFATQAICSTQILEHDLKVAPVVTTSRVPPLPGKGAALLAALSKPGMLESNGQSRRHAVEGSVMMSTENVVSRGDATTLRKPTILQPVMEDKVSKISSKLEAKANVQRANLPWHSPQPPLMNEENEHVILVGATGPFLPHTQSLSPGTSERRDDKETTISLGIAISASQVMTHDAGNQRKAAPVPAMHNIEHTNPFHALKRVPRSYARVPEDQRIILERKDSWVQSENDGRSDDVNISADVLQDLRCFMDRQAHGNGEGGNEVQAADMVLEMVDSHLRKKKADEQSDNSETESSRSDESGDREDDKSGESYQADWNEFISIPSPILEIETDHEHKGHKKDEDDDEDRATRQLTWSESPERVANIEKSQGSKGHQVCLEDFESAALYDAQGDARLSPPVILPKIFPAIDHVQLGKNIKTYARPRIDRDYHFPSSSLGIEDEMELDIPHVIGDQVDESDLDIACELKALQHLPSTAPFLDSIVQVVHTPFHNQRAKTTEFQDCGFLKEHLSPSEDGDRLGTDVPSDFIIPATFDEASQWIFPSTLQETHSTSKVDISAVPSKTGAQAQAQGLASTGNDVENADVAAERQLLGELISSQHNVRIEMDTSPAENSAFPTDPPARCYELGPSTLETELPSLLKVRARKHLSQSQAVSISSNNQRERTSSKRDIDSIVDQQLEKPNKRRSRLTMKSAVINLSQEDRPAVDIGEMARAHRHKFINLVENAAAAIAESLPNSTGNLSPRHEQRLEEPSPLDIPHEMEFSIQKPAISEDGPLNPRPVSAVPEDNLAGNRSLPNGSMSAKASQIMKLPSQATSLTEDESCAGNGRSTLAFEGYSTAFHKYTSTYQDYRGSQKRFTESLCYIEWLVSAKKKCPSQSLWDDFISTLATGYVDYARKVRDTGIDLKKATSGVDFFLNRNTGKDPFYTERIITSSTIEEAILSINPQEVEKARAPFLTTTNAPYRNLSMSTSKSVTSTASTPSVPALRPQENNLGFSDNNVQLESQSNDKNRQSGSVKDFLNDSSLKRPYFETHSQVGISKHHQSPSSGRGSTAKTPGGGRRLPWPKSTSSQEPSPVPQHRCRDLEVPPTFTLKARTYSNDPAVIEYQKSDPNKGPQDPQGSPILGPLDNCIPTLYPRPKDRTGSTNSLLREVQVPIDLSKMTSKTLARGTRSMPRTRITDLNRVDGWAADQNTASTGRGNKAFKEFLQRRKSAGLLANTSPKSNFCTKRSGDTVMD